MTHRIKYNAMVIDWMLCPDCKNNVLRAEAIDERGEPTGAIQCPECGFELLEMEPHAVALKWADICERVGYEYIPFFNGDRWVSVCCWCGNWGAT